jgi:hypothetical protein
MPWKGRHKLDARALFVDYLNGMEALAGKRTPSIHQALPKDLAWHLHHISCMVLLHLRVGRVSAIYLFKCSSCRPETIMTFALKQIGEHNGLGLEPAGRESIGRIALPPFLPFIASTLPIQSTLRTSTLPYKTLRRCARQGQNPALLLDPAKYPYSTCALPSHPSPLLVTLLD